MISLNTHNHGPPPSKYFSCLRSDGGRHFSLSQKVKILLHLMLIEIHVNHFLTCMFQIQLGKPTDNLPLREKVEKL